MKIDGIVNVWDALDAPKTKIWLFAFGAYGDTHVAVWAGPGRTSVDDALEDAAEWLSENAPGHLTSEEGMAALYEEAADDRGLPWPPDDWDDPEVRKVQEAAEADMTHTESGWLTSYEWTVNDLAADDPLYGKVFEETITGLAEEGELDEEEIEKANKIAVRLGLDVEWGFDDE